MITNAKNAIKQKDILVIALETVVMSLYTTVQHAINLLINVLYVIAIQFTQLLKELVVGFTFSDVESALTLLISVVHAMGDIMKLKENAAIMMYKNVIYVRIILINALYVLMDIIVQILVTVVTEIFKISVMTVKMTLKFAAGANMGL